MIAEKIKELRTRYPNHKLATIISYDLVNNFTDESIIKYLEDTYKVSIPDKTVHGDPYWYGRGSVLLTTEDFGKIPDNWEDPLSEGFDELEFLPKSEEH